MHRLGLKYRQVPCLVNGVEGVCHESLYKGNSKGYAQIPIGGRLLMVHRYVWEQQCGPIPAGMYIDHRCRNRKCINVMHLRVVTPRENALENSLGNSAINFRKTHCIHGHEFTPDNIYRDSDGYRECRACRRKQKKETAKRKAAKRREQRAHFGRIPAYAVVGDHGSGV